MRFVETALPGAWLVEIDSMPDERGFFARTFCRTEYARHGLPDQIVQQSVSWNEHAGTVRGLHFQRHPDDEDKLVRVTAGAIHDVIVDLRPGSATQGRWLGVELSARNRRQLLVPKGFAHGFQVLEPATEVLYQMSVEYVPGASAGILWNDPDLAITWPIAIDPADTRLLSAKDAALPRLKDFK